MSSIYWEKLLRGEVTDKESGLFRRLRREKVALRAARNECSGCSEESSACLGDLASLLKSFLESVDDSRDAIFDQGDIEVDEEPQTFVG